MDGNLGPRAPSGYDRIPAYVAGYGQPNIPDGFRRVFIKLLGALFEAVTNLTKMGQALLDKPWCFITNDRKLI